MTEILPVELSPQAAQLIIQLLKKGTSTLLVLPQSAVFMSQSGIRLGESPVGPALPGLLKLKIKNVPRASGPSAAIIPEEKIPSPRREPAGGQEEGFVFQLSDGGLGVLHNDDTNFGISADGKMAQAQA